MEDYLIRSLGLAIYQRMCNGGESPLTPEILKVVFDIISIELTPIVKDHGLRHTQTGDDVFPEKLSYLNCCYEGPHFRFYPLGEIINSHQKVLLLFGSLGKQL